MSEIGNLQVNEILISRGITKAELARLMGTSKENLNGKLKSPSFPTLVSIASALGVPMWQLFISPADAAKLVDPAGRKLLAFLHFDGESHTPGCTKEVVDLMEKWNAEELHEVAVTRVMEHARKCCAGNLRAMHLVDEFESLVRRKK